MTQDIIVELSESDLEIFYHAVEEGLIPSTADVTPSLIEVLREYFEKIDLTREEALR